MICASCGRAEATVFVKVIAGGAISQAALCADCASKAEAEAPADALLKLLAESAAARPRTPPSRCPDCQTSLAEFRASGRFGCAGCYAHFAPVLKNLLPRIHAGAYAHRGKTPPGA